MTPADHRAACIKAMAIAWLRYRGYKWPDDVQDWLMRLTIDEQTVSFDAIATAAARVVPAEATEEILAAYRGALKAKHDSMSPEEITALWGSRRRTGGHGHVFSEGMKAKARWAAMSAAGDLTNPPEEKA